MSINDPFRGVSAIFAARMRRGVGRHPALGEPLPRPAGRSLPAVTPAACASERLSRGRVFGRACPAEAAGHAPWDELHVQPWEHRAQGRGVGLNGAQKGSRRLVSSSGQSRLAGEHDQKDPTTHRGGVAIFCDCHADDAVFSPSPSSLASRLSRGISETERGLDYALLAPDFNVFVFACFNGALPWFTGTAVRPGDLKWGAAYSAVAPATQTAVCITDPTKVRPCW
jgi:hypothetical protein